jgi:hypothetical protein
MPSQAAVAWSGLAALAVAMGIGRFAFTPVLPMMQADGLSLEQGGWLAAANYAGYLGGALWTAVHPVRSDRAIQVSLAAIGVATLAMGLGHGFLAWFLLRAAAGVASAWVLIHVSSWTLARLQAPILASLVYAGVGSGIAFAGLACLLLMQLGSGADAAWTALGGAALAATAALWRRFGSQEAAQPAAPRPVPRGESTLLVLCYGAFGFGYIVPATFLPVMAKEIVPDPAVFGWAWPIFGAAAAASTLAAAPLTTVIGNRRVWIAGQLVMAIGVAAPLFAPGIGGVLASAICVGGTFMVNTMAGMKEARALAGPGAARLMAAMTASFAGGQVAGPAAASLWLRMGGSLQGVLWAAVALLVASAFALLLGKTGR